jgi:hypothetical protein
LEAHRAGKLVLLPGYGLEHGADVLLLRRGDGSVVATYQRQWRDPRGGDEDRRGGPQAKRQEKCLTTAPSV